MDSCFALGLGVFRGDSGQGAGAGDGECVVLASGSELVGLEYGSKVGAGVVCGTAGVMLA